MDDFFTQCLQGFTKFTQKLDTPSLQVLQTQQKPKALVIACSDSRVDPAILFSCDPGEIFVIRNVGNIVPPCTSDAAIHGVSAAIEYAVCVLEVPNIILLGHSNCGAIEALFKTTGGIFTQPWVDIIKNVHEYVETEYATFPITIRKRCCEISALYTSCKNLYTFPFIKQRCEANTLRIATYFFVLEEGKLIVIDQHTPLSNQIASITQD